MRRVPRGLAGVIGLALAASFVTPAAAQQARTALPATDLVRSVNVTLVTGDVVHLATYRDGRQAASLQRGPAAGRGAFATEQRDGHTYLFPDEAQPYVATGVLDERLFDITELAKQGYDDAHAKTLPLILEYGKGVRAAVVPAAAHRERTLASIGSVAVTVPRAKLGQFWEGVDDDRAGAAKPVLGGHLRKVWLDAKATVSLDVSVPMTGAPAAWAAGFDGAGMKVAVLDTGIDTTHPDVAGRIAETANFSTDPDVTDGHGHGTHVASTVAGNGAASGGKYKGVAPKAQLVIGKVLDHTGSGPASAVIAGMEWAASRAKVVSMSLGDAPTDGKDPMSQAVNKLSAQYGALFVIAAGNYGRAESVATPAAADAALTVGAISKSYDLASFSSQGPRLGDRAVKPEIVAPGVSITAARAAGTNPNIPADVRYIGMSGTSMATPHVAGAAILLAQQHPTWTGPQLKAALTSTAALTPAAGTVYQQGAGRVDLTRAVAQNLTADTGVLSMGRFLGPYGTVEPARKTVTYRNDGDADVALSLTAAAKNAAGADAPAGMLAVSPATLTVPAHGTATATVTLDPNVGDLGLYSGRLSATAADGKTALAAAIGYEKELLHTVTVSGIARDGRPAGKVSGGLWNSATGAYQRLYIPAGQSAKVEVRPGEWTLVGFVSTMDEPNVTEIDNTAITRDLTVAGDQSLVLDARGAKPVTIHTPKPTARLSAVHQVYREIGDRALLVGAGAWDRLSVVASGPPAKGRIEYAVTSDLQAPPLTARIAGANVGLHPLYLTPDWDVHQRFSGHRKLPAVFVGAGRPEDYAGRDVRGKAVLVRYTPGLTVTNQAMAAAAAKAAFVGVLATDPGVFQPLAAATVNLPTVSFGLADATELLRRLGQGPVTLDLDGVPYSPYRYLPSLPFRQLPDGVDYTMDSSNSALEHAQMYGVKANQVGWYADHVWRPYMQVSFALLYTRPFPFEQERYFSANDTTYDEAIEASDPPFDGMVGVARSFIAGQELTKTYFKGPIHAGASTVRPVNVRTGDRFLFTFDSVNDSEPDHVNGQQGNKTAARIYRDGELVAQNKYAVGYFDVGVAEPATYRVELDMPEGRPGWRIGTESYSAWTFRSSRTSEAVPIPFVVATWDLDLDLDNAAKAGRQFELRLNAGTQATATPAAIKTVKAWASFDDGGTWRRVAMDGSDGHFAGPLAHPALANTSGYVSLRMEVTDAAGGKLEQTIMRAYALK